MDAAGLQFQVNTIAWFRAARRRGIKPVKAVPITLLKSLFFFRSIELSFGTARLNAPVALFGIQKNSKHVSFNTGG
jgi:hypothetical protein